ATNIEWDPVNRGNHYLSDQVGLIFAASALTSEPEAATWLEASTTELKSEIRLQFHRDGSNVEGSTAYHGLSTELAIYGMAVLAGNGDAAMGTGTEFSERLRSMLAFSSAVTGPDRNVVQIGDADSGRLLNLAPGRAALDQSHLLDAAAGLSPKSVGQSAGPHGSLVRA